MIVPRSLISGDTVDYQYLFPLGLAYISSTLKQNGHAVSCLNLNHYAGTIEELVHSFLKKDGGIDFVCTGGLSTAYHQIKRVVNAVRTSGLNARVILGGGLISSEPELMFKNLKPDYIVLGEGEETVKELLSCLENGNDLIDVAGIGYCTKDGAFVSTKARPPIMELDALPWPDFEGFGFETYLDNQKPTDQYSYDLFDYPRVYPIITSRSCPFLCTFCFHPIGNKYRQRSLDSIMQELEVMVRRYRINVIAIYDELFSHNSERVYEFCRRFKSFLETIPWDCKWGCQMRVDRINDELLATMRNAGCYMISYGFESYSQTVLTSMKKHITNRQIDNAINTTLRNSLSIQANFIFGDRAETVHSAHETLEYWKQNNHAGIVLGYINPYPGTQLYQYCIERGIIRDRLDFIENHIFDALNMSETMTDTEFLKLKIEILMGQLKYYVTVVPLSVSQEEGGTFSLRVACPHCRKEIEYRNYSLPNANIFNVITYCRNCRRRFFMVSRAYSCLMKAVLLVLAAMPMALKLKLFEYMEKLKPWLIKKLMSGKGNMSKIKKMLFP